tara:strand:+ start:3751 stop:4572 length:822 start_codon:yes stop_codon:yes gene_type:complete
MSKGATVSKTEVPAYQEQAFKDLYAAGRQVAGMPFVPYTGPMVAGFSPDQLEAFEATRGLFGETQAFSPVSQLQQLAQAPLDVSAYMSPYQEAVIDPALRGIQERQDVAQQAAQEAALKAGAFGGSRGTILESEAQRPYIQQAADTEAALREAGYQQALQTAAQQQDFQAGLLGDLYGQQLQGLGMLSGIGGQQQQLQQAALQAARGEFERALGYPAQQLGYLTGAISGVPTLPTQYQQKKTGLGDVLGGLSSLFGAGLYGGAFSEGGRFSGG